MIPRKSILEKLAATNPHCEIWWDASPLVFENWAKRIVGNADISEKTAREEAVSHTFGHSGAEKMLFSGVTTNPERTWQAIQDDPDFWSKFTKELIENRPDAGVEEIYWLLYVGILCRGAALMLPLWQKSSGRFGYVCGQVDPRFTRDLNAMKRQALSLIAASPNVMVKCPGSAEGLQLVEQLTAMGIPTNATMSFSVSQYVECMNAVSRGIDKAVSGKIDMSRWRSVITHMSSRIGELGELQSQAKARNINLTPADIRWAEIAIFKKAYFLGLKRNHPSKMLMCSMRIDHDLEPGRPSSWHIEKVAGSAAVFTCPPSYIAGLMEVEHAIPELNPDAINEKIPEAVLDRLKRVPFFEQSYEIDGMTTAEFSRYASFERTEAEFSKAAAKIIGFTAEQFSAPGRSAVSYE